MWLVLAFLSAALLGFYDAFKKKALSGNAVIPVLFLNTLFSSLIFLPFIILSYTGNSLDGTMFHVAEGGWEVHKYIVHAHRCGQGKDYDGAVPRHPAQWQPQRCG